VSVLLAITTGMGVAKNVAVGKNPLAVTVADYNGDSKLDVAVASSDDNSVAVLLNSGTGTLTATTPLAVCSFPSALAAADMDGDGRSDLVVSCDGGTDIKYWMGFGDGAFFPSSTSESLSSNSLMALADLNGDTKMDLVYVQDALELATSRLNRTP
jgi:ankyrin repeat protein